MKLFSHLLALRSPDMRWSAKFVQSSMALPRSPVLSTIEAGLVLKMVRLRMSSPAPRPAPPEEVVLAAEVEPAWPLPDPDPATD